MKDSQKKTFGESLALTQQSIDFPSTFVGIEMHSNTDKFQREMHHRLMNFNPFRDCFWFQLVQTHVFHGGIWWESRPFCIINFSTFVTSVGQSWCERTKLCVDTLGDHSFDIPGVSTEYTCIQSMRWYGRMTIIYNYDNNERRTKVTDGSVDILILKYIDVIIICEVFVFRHTCLPIWAFPFIVSSS